MNQKNTHTHTHTRFVVYKFAEFVKQVGEDLWCSRTPGCQKIFDLIEVLLRVKDCVYINCGVLSSRKNKDTKKAKIL